MKIRRKTYYEPRELSKTGRSVVTAGLLLCFLVTGVFLWPWTAEKLIVVLVVSLPALALLYSLTVGEASRGKGFLGSKFLFIFGCVLVTAAFVPDEDFPINQRAWFIFMGSLLFAFARSRRIKERGGWV